MVMQPIIIAAMARALTVAAFGLTGLATLPQPGLAQANAEYQTDPEPGPEPEPGSGSPQDARAPQPMLIGAASNFSQGWQERLYDSASALPVRHYRDGINWRLAEPSRGSYRLERGRAAYPARLAESGGDLVLTMNWGNPLYDRGKTPHSPAALAAFGQFAAAMVERFPAITAVEVGNEVNGANFVNGPVRRSGIAERGRFHLAMVQSVARAVRAVRPEVRILGGATHSIPAGFLWPLLEEGGAAAMDGIAIHPYKTAIDQLAAQIGVLRRHPAARAMPIEITEFGSNDPLRAPADLVRGYATLASLGVRAFYWYPLNERGDGMVPLIARDGSVTAAGEAFGFVQSRLAERVARDVSPDAFTFIHRFGDDTLVLWGEPRPITLTGSGIAAHDAAGHRLDPAGLALSADHPIILTADRPIDPATDLSLGCTTLVADTFYQFRYPGGAAATNAPDPVFEPHIERNGEREDWITLPGQHRGGVPWVPYLSGSHDEFLRLTAESMRVGASKGASKGASVRVVHEYLPRQAGRFRLEARAALPPQAKPGLDFAVSSGARLLDARTGQQAAEFDAPVQLEANVPLQIRIGPEGTARLHNLAYRLRLHDPDRCAL